MVEDLVAPYASPDDVRLVLNFLGTVTERGSTVRSPRHFEDARRSLNALHAKALSNLSAQLEILDELRDRTQEQLLLRPSQRIEVAPKPS